VSNAAVLTDNMGGGRMAANDKAKETRPEGQVETADVHYHVLTSGQQFLLVRHSHAWHPATDVMVDDDRLIVVVEIAGMRNGEFYITFANQRLSISGVRSPKEQGHAAYHQLEVRYGEFRTDVTMPWAVDEDKILAHYEDGFLQVELPRAKQIKVHVVEIDKDAK
jgi:HSP20 family protein